MAEGGDSLAKCMYRPERQDQTRARTSPRRTTSPPATHAGRPRRGPARHNTSARGGSRERWRVHGPHVARATPAAAAAAGRVVDQACDRWPNRCAPERPARHRDPLSACAPVFRVYPLQSIPDLLAPRRRAPATKTSRPTIGPRVAIEAHDGIVQGSHSHFRDQPALIAPGRVVQATIVGEVLLSSQNWPMPSISRGVINCAAIHSAG